jgi:hypothetical protein
MPGHQTDVSWAVAPVRSDDLNTDDRRFDKPKTAKRVSQQETGIKGGINMWKTLWNGTIEYVKTVVAHAVSAAGVGALYELQAKLISGVALNWEVVLTAVALGGCIGFVKSLLASLEATKAAPVGVGATPVAAKKSWRPYFGL